VSWRNKPSKTQRDSKQMNPEITWRMPKQLEQRAEILMHGVGGVPTPENTFLAYLAIDFVSSVGSDSPLFLFLFILSLSLSPLSHYCVVGTQ
uniref:Uncharacterized protein n=1 Tax=Cyanoderma ruficeps TaxID=181631 RepID=A0A8C3P599_9PASS